MKGFEKYCTPARIYLGISVIAIISIVIQNIVNKNNNELCIGMHKCSMEHKSLVLLFKILYMFLWAWLLNYLCSKGLKKLAWAILLIPFLLIAIIMASMMVAINNKEIIVVTPN